LLASENLARFSVVHSIDISSCPQARKQGSGDRRERMKCRSSLANRDSKIF
jgi:hypothetical protein